MSSSSPKNPDAPLTDYFTTKDGETFAGLHLLIEVWGSKKLTDPRFIDQTLCEAAKAAGATILHSHMHHFSPFDGVSGVVLLAESHISIHTWPEREYAAIDIFMCGECDPHLAVPVIKLGFEEKKSLFRSIAAGLYKAPDKSLTA